MKLLVLIIFIAINFVSAQNVEGDYRTRLNGGFWHTPSNWQVFYNGSWQDLPSTTAGPFRNITPTSSSGKILIRHTISILLNVNLNQVTINGNGRIIVNSSAVVVFVDDFIEPPLLIENGGTLTNNVGTLDFQSQLTTTPCQIFGTLESASSLNSSNPNVILFNSGSIYKHLNRTGGNVPMASWDINSTCVIARLSNSGPAKPNNLSQEFGNFVWNTPDMGSIANFSLDGDLHEVKGDLAFINTGSPSREVRLNSGGQGYTLTVGKNLIVLNGIVTLAENQTSLTSIQIGGNLEVHGGSLTLAKSNNVPVHILIKGELKKIGGTLSQGTGTGVCKLLPHL